MTDPQRIEMLSAEGDLDATLACVQHAHRINDTDKVRMMLHRAFCLGCDEIILDLESYLEFSPVSVECNYKGYINILSVHYAHPNQRGWALPACVFTRVRMMEALPPGSYRAVLNGNFSDQNPVWHHIADDDSLVGRTLDREVEIYPEITDIHQPVAHVHFRLDLAFDTREALDRWKPQFFAPKLKVWAAFDDGHNSPFNHPDINRAISSRDAIMRDVHHFLANKEVPYPSYLFFSFTGNLKYGNIVEKLTWHKHIARAFACDVLEMFASQWGDHQDMLLDVLALVRYECAHHAINDHQTGIARHLVIPIGKESNRYELNVGSIQTCPSDILKRSHYLQTIEDNHESRHFLRYALLNFLTKPGNSKHESPNEAKDYVKYFLRMVSYYMLISDPINAGVDMTLAHAIEFLEHSGSKRQCWLLHVQIDNLLLAWMLGLRQLGKPTADGMLPVMRSRRGRFLSHMLGEIAKAKNVSISDDALYDRLTAQDEYRECYDEAESLDMGFVQHARRFYAIYKPGSFMRLITYGLNSFMDYLIEHRKPPTTRLVHIIDGEGGTMRLVIEVDCKTCQRAVTIEQTNIEFYAHFGSYTENVYLDSTNIVSGAENVSGVSAQAHCPHCRALFDFCGTDILPPFWPKLLRDLIEEHGF